MTGRRTPASELGRNGQDPGAPHAPKGVAVVARLRAQPGRGNHLLDALKAVTASAGTEVGTSTYVLHQSGDEPDVLWIYARFVDHDALVKHQANEAALSQVAAEVSGLLAEAPDVTYGVVLSEK